MEPSPSAVHVAIGALARRELSTTELLTRLTRAGIEHDEAESVVTYLQEAGYVSDSRAARARAGVLAARPIGDAAIIADLERRGTPQREIEDALAELTPELERAGVLLERLGGGPRLARSLASKGFSSDTIEAVVDAAIADEL